MPSSYAMIVFQPPVLCGVVEAQVVTERCQTASEFVRAGRRLPTTATDTCLDVDTGRAATFAAPAERW